MSRMTVMPHNLPGGRNLRVVLLTDAQISEDSIVTYDGTISKLHPNRQLAE